MQLIRFIINGNKYGIFIIYTRGSLYTAHYLQIVSLAGYHNI
jgi:hypothetical protein